MAAENPILAFLDELDQSMLDLYGEYVETGVGVWEGFSGNPGQESIVRHHVLPVVMKHVKDAKDRWPMGVGADDYLDAVLSCYDADVLMNALSDTIFQSYDELYATWQEAYMLEGEHDAIAPTGPHSTEAVWR